MATRTHSSFVSPNSTNALIYGYGGFSLAAPQSHKSVWWTDDRINEKVTRKFISQRLKPEEKARLDVPIGFGGLSDYTYLEWILEKAKRIFLILAECGVPHRIFAVVDASWDDGDLPLPLEAMEQLTLSNQDEVNKCLCQRFHTIQYSYLLHDLREGSHIDYKKHEVIPVEYVNKAPAPCLQAWSRVKVPNRKDVLVQRKVTLQGTDFPEARDAFVADIQFARAMQHPHVASVWASYTSKEAGYFLTDFVGEHTLKSFLDHKSPVQFSKLSKEERTQLLLKWLHCLADALAAIHRRGISHSAVRPSNILIDGQNTIAFSDIGSISSLQGDKKHEFEEVYNYSSPEEQSKKTIVVPTPKLHKRSSSVGSNFSVNSASSTGSAKNSEEKGFFARFSRSNSTASRDSSKDLPKDLPPMPPPKPAPAPPLEIPGVAPRTHNNLSAHTKFIPPPPPPPPATQAPPAPPAPPKSASGLHSHGLPPLPELSTNTSEKADIFSLGCVFLDLISFLMKRKNSDFNKHRSTKHRSAPPPLHPGALPNHPDLPSPVQKDTVWSDSSFHANPDKISSWIDQLDRAAFGSSEEVHRGVPHLLSVARGMLSLNPVMRPTANEVEQRIHDILTKFCGLAEDSLHCGKNRLRPSPSVAGKAPRRRARTADAGKRPIIGEPMPVSHSHSASQGHMSLRTPIYAPPPRNLPPPVPPPSSPPPELPTPPRPAPPMDYPPRPASVMGYAPIQRPQSVSGIMVPPSMYPPPEYPLPESLVDVPPPIPRRSSRRPAPFAQTAYPPQAQHMPRPSGSPPRSNPPNFALGGMRMSRSSSSASSSNSWRSRSSSGTSHGSTSPSSAGFRVGSPAAYASHEMRFVDFRQNREWRAGNEVKEGRVGREYADTKAVQDVRDVEYIIDDYMRSMKVDKMRDDLWNEQIEVNAF